MAEAVHITKPCSTCRVEKPLEAFYPQKLGRHGRQAECKECARAAKRARRCYDPPPQKRCCACDEVKPATEFNRACAQSDGLSSRCKACRRALPYRSSEMRRKAREQAAAKQGRKLRCRRTPDEIRADDERRRQAIEKARAARIAARPWTDPGLSKTERYALRYRLDPEFNLRERLRLQIKKQRRGGKIPDHIRAALARENSAPPKLEERLGYRIADLKVHIERQFTKRMKWARFFSGDIHIDHIVPLASFDLSDPDELRAAWAITNLRPMWAEKNVEKGSDRMVLL